MARRKATALTTEAPISLEPLAEAPDTATTVLDASAKGVPSHATAGEKTFGPDPREELSATLGPTNNGPKMHLLRSYKYRQMQIRFENEPADKYKEMLAEAAWRDRTEEEGVWTRQIPKEGERWRTVADAERLFTRIANEIRADQGLGPVTFSLNR